MLSLSPGLRAVLSDPYSRSWDAQHGLRVWSADAHDIDLPAELETIRRTTAVAPRKWFGKRLPVLWTTFMASRPADERALTVWMMEAARLLGDLPHDIVAYSIDAAIKESTHGFIPSVGEIRAIADPLARERQQQVARLEQMVGALRDPEVAAELRREREALRRHRETADRASRSSEPGA